MAKKDPFSLEGALAELGPLESVADFDAAMQKMADKMDGLRKHIGELEYKRAAALDALDGATCVGIDARLLELRKLTPDLEACARILHQRAQDARVAESVRTAPPLFEALEPLARKVEEARKVEGAALRALATAADRCAGAWGCIPPSEVPSRSEADDALIRRVDGLLGGGSHGRIKFDLPRAPRDRGPVRTVTMQRRSEPETINVRSRGRVG